MLEERLIETVSLEQAKSLLKAMAHKESLLLLSPPGIGKSEIVVQAAEEMGLPCRSLLGTQIAPEDVSGIPRIIGDRSVFCPPRILLPENPEPFCLFLDELPACAPDVQKAFYSLLLERRLGEHSLPEGTWVVAAGNRIEDRAMVRSMSSALVNRVFVLQIEPLLKDWVVWAKKNGVRSEIIAFVLFMPSAFMRSVPNTPSPFSTPRAWTSLSRAIDMIEKAGLDDPQYRRALTFGRVSASDAALFCAMYEQNLEGLYDTIYYMKNPDEIPAEDTLRWFVLHSVRSLVEREELDLTPAETNHFLRSLSKEHRFAMLIDLVYEWSRLGGDPVMLDTLVEVTGMPLS